MVQSAPLKVTPLSPWLPLITVPEMVIRASTLKLQVVSAAGWSPRLLATPVLTEARYVAPSVNGMDGV